MDIDFSTWLSLGLRWLHMITGIAWIGSSFYFIWLDNSLAAPKSEEDKRLGVGGELWAVHGGGFYHNKKYQIAPTHMPADLHWFKWEAYFTWISGFLLLALMYYHGAEMLLIDRARADLTQAQAIFIGLLSIAGGWVVYDELCKSPLGDNNRRFGIVWFLALTAAAWALGQVFSGRGAYIHVGAIIGTVMAANVFCVIIPNQKKTVAALLAGEKPDPALGKKAKQRSLHNNYMTLPVLLIMISNHYPVLFGHAQAWLLLAGLGAAAWPIREFFNKKHKGTVNYAYPVAGVALFCLVMFYAGGGFAPAKMPAEGTLVAVTDAEVKQIIRTHCSACHSDVPVHDSVAGVAPLGVALDTMADVRKHAARIRAQTVDTDIMPLGNETGMTAAEREKLGRWLAAQE